MTILFIFYFHPQKIANRFSEKFIFLSDITFLANRRYGNIKLVDTTFRTN